MFAFRIRAELQLELELVAIWVVYRDIYIYRYINIENQYRRYNMVYSTVHTHKWCVYKYVYVCYFPFYIYIHTHLYIYIKVQNCFLCFFFCLSLVLHYVLIYLKDFASCVPCLVLWMHIFLYVCRYFDFRLPWSKIHRA